MLRLGSEGIDTECLKLSQGIVEFKYEGRR